MRTLAIDSNGNLADYSVMIGMMSPCQTFVTRLPNSELVLVVQINMGEPVRPLPYQVQQAIAQGVLG